MPSEHDTAVFLLRSAGYTVDFTGPATTRNLSVGADDVTLDLNANTYTLLNTPTAGTGAMTVGSVTPGVSRLRLADGTLSAYEANIGSGTALTGSATVGAGANLVVGRLAKIGASGGSGTLQIESGGRLLMSNTAGIPSYTINLMVGDIAAHGTLYLSGAGAEVENLAATGVGAQGVGTLIVENGARMTDSSAYIGFGIGSSGATGHAIIRGEGTVWTTRDGRAIGGDNSSGFVTVADGALMETTSTQYAEIIDARGTLSVAQVRVTGSGSRYELARALVVANFGRGELLVEDGGHVATPIINIAQSAGSNQVGEGTITITGAGSRVEVADSLSVGRNPSGGNPAGIGELFILDGGELSAPGATTVAQKGTITFAAGTFSTGLLNMAGGKLFLTAGADKVVRTASLAFAQGGAIELADNAMLVDYETDSSIDAVRGYITAGVIGSSLANTSHGLGYAEASELPTVPNIFGGVSGDAVLVRFTRLGDADLDGQVNLADFNALAAGFGTSDAFWFGGDFNYDGTVNLADFNLLAANFGLAASGTEVTPQDWANLAAAVPEPGAVGGFGLIAIYGAARRRRRGARHD